MEKQNEISLGRLSKEIVAPVLRSLRPAPGGAHNLIHPVAPTTDGVEREVGGTLVYRALDPGARVAEAVDELFAGEWVRKDPDIQAVRQPVRQDPHLISQGYEVVVWVWSAVVVLLQVVVVVLVFKLALLILHLGHSSCWRRRGSDWTRRDFSCRGHNRSPGS